MVTKGKTKLVKEMKDNKTLNIMKYYNNGNIVFKIINSFELS